VRLIFHADVDTAEFVAKVDREGALLDTKTDKARAELEGLAESNRALPERAKDGTDTRRRADSIMVENKFTIDYTQLDVV